MATQFTSWGGVGLEAEVKPVLTHEVFRLLWQKKRLSRADIARELNLSRSTASKIVDALLETNIVAEIGTAASTGGRKPIVLEFQDDARFILGVDLGARHVAVTLTDLRSKLIGWTEQQFPVRDDPEGTRKLVMELGDKLLAERKVQRDHLLSLGVAVPSPVDPRHPKWISEVVIPAWKGKSGLDVLQKHFRVPVLIDNDANLGALAEHWWGAGRGYSDLAYIKLAHGIGAGYILNGQIYRGAFGVAGEFGHIPINPNGKQCVCGMRGCLATYLAAPELRKRIEELADDYPGSPLLESGVPLQQAVREEDPLALRLADEIAEYLSIAVVALINMMNPSLVVLGGGLAELGERILLPVRTRVASSTLVSKAAAEVRKSALGERATAVGAATLALQDVLNNPGNYFSLGNGIKNGK